MNPSKCAVNSLNQPQLGISSPGMEDIPILGSSSLYKYLGAEQNALINMEQLWARTIEKALAAAKRIMLSDLAYAISCIIYGTGKFGTMRKQARAFDESIRKLLAESRMRFNHSCTPRLYVNKEEGGLGLKSAEEEMEHTVVYTWPEFEIPYSLCESLRRSNKRSLTSDFRAVMAENRLENEVKRLAQASIQVKDRTFATPTEAARAISTLVHERWARTRMHEWRQRAVASRVISEDDGHPHVCLKDSFLWSQTGWVSSEVLRNVWAAQEASLPTKGSAPGQTIWANSNQLCRMGVMPKKRQNT
ncbi:hypothetical protein COOONC_05942 [Cooperia oncophora]